MSARWRVRAKYVIERSIFADDQDDVLDRRARQVAPIVGFVRVSRRQAGEASEYCPAAEGRNPSPVEWAAHNLPLEGRQVATLRVIYDRLIAVTTINAAPRRYARFFPDTETGGTIS